MKMYKFEPIIILNGQSGLHDTERAFYNKCVKDSVDITIIDNVFEDQEKIKAIKYLKPKTIMVGTTGTYAEELSESKEMFKSMGYIPENVIFTMGEDYFHSIINDIRDKTTIKTFRIEPMTFSDDEIVLEEFTD